MNAQFRHLVVGARALGLQVIDRCNLTILLEPGQEDTAEFLAEHRVRVVASLPCTTEETVDKQRGRRVFERSIEALHKLGRLGYGRPGSPLTLDLVYNPPGATLPPPQAELEAIYRRDLKERFGIEFHHLLAITNMPIRRFAHALARQGEAEAYIALLIAHFNPATVSELMCRSLVSIGYDGRLHDCDFNQMLDLPLGGKARTIWEVSDLTGLEGDPVETARHCFGCTAGAGSSCDGTLR
jgi:radical SAM/Cys-rich protein